MKTIFAKEKSEYTHMVMDAINLNLSQKTRDDAVRRLEQIEKDVKSQGDEMIFIVSTKNTNINGYASPMDRKLCCY